jgi:hypothetical protein
MTVTAPSAAAPMLIDRLQPHFDATIVRHAVAEAPAERAYAAALGTDLLALAHDDPVFRVLFALRGLPDRVVTVLGGGPPTPPPDAMRLRDLPATGEWVRLGEDPGREIVFGAIGRFWGAQIRWETIDAPDFAAFEQPGYGKIAAAVSVRPYGEERALLSYEARTAVTDPASRAAFLRYWRALSPFIGVLLQRTLTAMAR